MTVKPIREKNLASDAAPNASSAQASIEQMLRPLPFKREHFQAYVFTSYSRKAHGRVYVYYLERSALFEHLEIDPTIIRLNPRVAPQVVPLTGSRTAEFEPDAVSLDQDGKLTVHVIDAEIDGYLNPGTKPDDPPPDIRRSDVLWDPWCKQRRFSLRLWSKSELFSEALWRTEMMQLVRRASLANYIADAALEEQIIDELVPTRYLSIRDLKSRFPKNDPVRIEAALACLVLSGRAFTDLRLAPLSPTTHVSCRPIFPNSSD